LKVPQLEKRKDWVAFVAILKVLQTETWNVVQFRIIWKWGW
jgi:hypothetical protein